MKQKYLLLYCFSFAFLLLSGCGGGGKPENGQMADSTADTTLTLQQQIGKLTEAINQSPNNFQHYYDRSLLFYKSGNTMQAVDDVNNSIRLFQTWPEGYHLRGFYALKSNQYDTALVYFKKATELGSTNPETFHSIGQIYYEQNNLDEAEKWFDTAILLDSLDPQYSMDKAIVYEGRKNYPKAISFYEDALRKEPGYTKALWRLYMIYKEVKKDIGRAMQYNDMILRTDSLHPMGNFNQGLFYMESALEIDDTTKNDEFRIVISQAIRQFDKTLRVDPNFEGAAFRRAYCYMLIGKYPEALRDFTTAIEQKPFNDKAYFLKGSILEKLGDKQNALLNFEQALAINPNFREAAQAVKELKAVQGKK